MMCFKCGSENTGFRAICNICMTTQAIEDVIRDAMRGEIKGHH
jgi:NMD protein affecting ribosome stability and mRNA decay